MDTRLSDGQTQYTEKRDTSSLPAKANSSCFYRHDGVVSKNRMLRIIKSTPLLWEREKDVQRRPSDRNRDIDRRYTQKNKTVKQNWWDLVVKPGTNHETDSYVSTIKSVGWQGEIGKRHLAKEGSIFFLYTFIFGHYTLEASGNPLLHHDSFHVSESARGRDWVDTFQLPTSQPRRAERQQTQGLCMMQSLLGKPRLQ